MKTYTLNDIRAVCEEIWNCGNSCEYDLDGIVFGTDTGYADQGLEYLLMILESREAKEVEG